MKVCGSCSVSDSCAIIRYTRVNYLLQIIIIIIIDCFYLSIVLARDQQTQHFSSKKKKKKKNPVCQSGYINAVTSPLIHKSNNMLPVQRGLISLRRPNYKSFFSFFFFSRFLSPSARLLDTSHHRRGPNDTKHAEVWIKHIKSGSSYSLLL